MGTTADKLNKILSSKEAIRTSIANKGVDISTSTPLSEYASKIDSIEKGGGISFNIDTSVSNGTDLKGITTNITSSNLPTLNFSINGSLLENKGVYSGFAYYNYIYNLYNKNTEDVIVRFKITTGSVISGEQYIYSSDGTYGLFLVNGKIGNYCVKESKSYQIYEATANTTYYISIKLTEQDTSANTVKEYYYISTTDFSTADSDLFMSYTENLKTSTSGTLGVHYNSKNYSFYGSVDMQSSCVLNADGSYNTRYYTIEED